MEEHHTFNNQPAENATDNGQRKSLSIGQLMLRRFFRHKLAMSGAVVVLIFIAMAIFAEFFTPVAPFRYGELEYAPPQRVHMVRDGRLQRPFVYGIVREFDPATFQTTYTEDKETVHPIRFFVRGYEYRLLGLIPTDIHLFGLEDAEGPYLLGTDHLGRDLLSRIIYGSRISLGVAFSAVWLGLILGVFFGGISGYFGGIPDMIIQRVIEVIMSVPQLPLWMALSAAIPIDWPIERRYMAIVVILSFIGWTGLARVVRGKFISLREEDFIIAARSYSTPTLRIIRMHMVPNFLSYILVNLTLSIPALILTETSLGFLGLGLRPPAISWGVLLQRAQSFQTVAMYPWILLPSVFVVIAVLAFNFVGDGLRDAADPFQKL